MEADRKRGSVKIVRTTTVSAGSGVFNTIDPKTCAFLCIALQELSHLSLLHLPRCLSAGDEDSCSIKRNAFATRVFSCMQFTYVSTRFSKSWSKYLTETVVLAIFAECFGGLKESLPSPS